MILSRSFWLDTGLVAVSCFALVYLNQPSRSHWVVSVTDAGQPPRTFRVEAKEIDPAELRQSILRQALPPVRPQWALVRWQKETAEFYANSDSDSARGSEPALTESESPSRADAVAFRTAAARSPDESTFAEIGGSSWGEFWKNRQVKAERWLAHDQKRQESQVRSLDQALVISMSTQWTDPRSFFAGGCIFACSVVLLASIWHWLQPPRSWRTRFEGEADRRPQDEEVDQAEMSFRETWVRLRQPAGVILRRGIGGGLIAAAIVSGVGHLLVNRFLG